ncbi:NAD(P)/FAD-dependent oxidoreductase [Gayadomonas joobiniege]|uniref:NAD(P)/FAD-dependent oxidoreductase n=1 Tax=Gayadomonas joobiniege TaxID=1234606 RepID=UPI000376D802|nr:FAD-dependent oxidoreductase [Gayadomonas joobiniege]
MTTKNQQTCVVIGASHGGVNFAFALRKEGWQGDIILFDVDPVLPYHRPPLSKAYLSSSDKIEKHALKAEEAYQKNDIQLRLGVRVAAINRSEQSVTLDNGQVQNYDKLVIASGARPLMPPIEGMQTVNHLYPLRTAADVENIRNAFLQSRRKKVVVIGGGYIGLETAASLNKMGAEVTVLERESRLLARVTAPYMSDYFKHLHESQGVSVCTGQNVTKIETENNNNRVICADGKAFDADVIIVGVGIRVNLELAEDAGLKIENGISVDETACTTDENIYAIGDCSWFFNQHYQTHIRLESVQNAVDQAKVAAKAIVGKTVSYDALPWFWSDQYDVKLQMVGLSTGYDDFVVRNEKDSKNKFSVWYFNGDRLLSVDAVNNAKAYVLATKLIKSGAIIDKGKLADPDVEFKTENLLIN